MTKLLKYMTVAAVLLAVCGPLKAVAGEADTVGVTVKEKPALRNVKVKMNALVAIGVVNPAVEFKVMDNFTVQMEALGVFWEQANRWCSVHLSLSSGTIPRRNSKVSL